MSIRISHLTKQFGQQKAVDDLTFEVGRGEILGFLGPNGAGKTTTMRMITGFLAPDSGQIEVAGEAVTEENVAIRRRIGYLPEHNPLYTDMYVREYLRYIARIYQVSHPASRISDVIQLTGLQKESHKKIASLSKGYRQRVGLAQAILHDPDVLILDEATSGLDPNQLVEIRSMIKVLGKTKSILLSTHIMQEVQALCDRVVIITQGKMVANHPIGMLSQMVSRQYPVRVRFSRLVFDNTLREIAGYISHTQDGENTYIIQGETEQINEAVFDFAISKNLKILEMRTLEESVEKIFTELTSKSQA